MENPETIMPPKDIISYWPDNVFIPKGLLPILPDEPFIRDFVYLVCVGAVCLSATAICVSIHTNDYVAILPIGLVLILALHFGASSNRAYMAYANASSKYLWAQKQQQRGTDNGKQ